MNRGLRRFLVFSLDLLQTAPVIPMMYFSNSESVVHSRNVIWARLPLSVPVSVDSVSVSRKGRKLGPSRHGEGKVDEDGDCEESTESTDVRPRVTARLVTPTPAAVPCGRAALAGGRSTAAATS